MRYRLRTLMIATAFVAVILGASLAMWRGELIVAYLITATPLAKWYISQQIRARNTKSSMTRNRVSTLLILLVVVPIVLVVLVPVVGTIYALWNMLRGRAEF
jgi:quinol-cytochrome oxidoreductase complex cytochrome b subunit